MNNTLYLASKMNSFSTAQMFVLNQSMSKLKLNHNDQSIYAVCLSTNLS